VVFVTSVDNQASREHDPDWGANPSALDVDRDFPIADQGRGSRDGDGGMIGVLLVYASIVTIAMAMAIWLWQR